ncbi:MAG: hypothetical protein EXR86_12350 [Gammaproteobacteria bacterium]|nr:hypothetical protein [Gammaproteobacteria bacterium]
MITIKTNGKVYEAAVCERGCKVWPPSSMGMHMDAHKKRDEDGLKGGYFAGRKRAARTKPSHEGRPHNG